jgi:hypothetical protein
VDAKRRAPPEAARDLYTTNATTVIACRGDVCDPVGYPSERNITSAILRLARDRAIRVYFTVGHGEIDLASESDAGFSGVGSMLRDQGLEPQALVGPAATEVPADADVVVVRRPSATCCRGFAVLEPIWRAAADAGPLGAGQARTLGFPARHGFVLPPGSCSTPPRGPRS